jgi:hypothetical protein
LFIYHNHNHNNLRQSLFFFFYALLILFLVTKITSQSDHFDNNLNDRDDEHTPTHQHFNPHCDQTTQRVETAMAATVAAAAGPRTESNHL